MSKVQHLMSIKIILLLLAIVFLPLLLGLGFWQLDRAAQKQQLLSRWQDAPTLDHLPSSPVTDGSRITLSGLFLNQRQYLLDNRTRDGRVGYELVVLFQPEHTARLLLVNLGWFAAPASRYQLPEVRLPRQPVRLEGRMITPVAAYQLADDIWTDGPVVRIQQLDMARLQGLYPGLYPSLLRLDEPLLPDFRVDWPLVNMPPERHIGYAVQWFGLAAVLLTGCLVMLWQRFRRVSS